MQDFLKNWFSLQIVHFLEQGICWAEITLFVGFYFFMRSMILSSFLHVTTTSRYSGSFGNVNCFSTQIFACFEDLRLDPLWHSMLEALNRSTSLSEIHIDVAYNGAIF